MKYRVNVVEWIHLYFSKLCLQKGKFFVISGSLWHEEVTVGFQQKDNKNALFVGVPIELNVSSEFTSTFQNCVFTKDIIFLLSGSLWHE